MTNEDSDRAEARAGIETPPRSASGILRRLGPGLIIAGSIVGSGELIATTKTGAEAGFALLWLILIGCVIKVFTQVELGRYTILTQKTTMEGLNELPGPAFSFQPRGASRGRALRANWFLWYWLLMTAAGIGQLGGIVGSVGQALSISIPLTDSGRAYNEASARFIELQVDRARGRLTRSDGATDVDPERERSFAPLEAEVESLATESRDDVYWALLITILTIALLVVGRYGLIQSFSTAMVACFTLVTIGNLVALEAHEEWAVKPAEIWQGLRFRLAISGGDSATSPLTTALMTFGIIGVGAAELLAYPYWCLEKGYARFTGPRDDSPGWADRARGWMRVLRWDAWCSMVIYTFATVAFYLLGAAILWRVGLNPAGGELIATLATMYVPVFGAYAQTLFLFGSFAVLYSTFFVATAGAARVMADALRVVGLWEGSETNQRRAVRVASVIYPTLSFTVYTFIREPAKLILLSGAMQAIMLPMLAGGALYFRYRRMDSRIAPGKIWDAMLWVSGFGMLLAGGYNLLRLFIP